MSDHSDVQRLMIRTQIAILETLSETTGKRNELLAVRDEWCKLLVEHDKETKQRLLEESWRRAVYNGPARPASNHSGLGNDRDGL